MAKQPRRYNTSPESPRAKKAVTGAAPTSAVDARPKMASARPKKAGPPLRRSEAPDPQEGEKDALASPAIDAERE